MLEVHSLRHFPIAWIKIKVQEFKISITIFLINNFQISRNINLSVYFFWEGWITENFFFSSIGISLGLFFVYHQLGRFEILGTLREMSTITNRLLKLFIAVWTAVRLSSIRVWAGYVDLLSCIVEACIEESFDQSGPVRTIWYARPQGFG